MAATVLDGLEAVRAAVGSHLGYSDWLSISQERADRFAQATLTEPTGEPTGEPASESESEEAIAEPYLVLALSNLFLPQILEVRGVSLGVNYGCDLIRFPMAVPIGAKLRAQAVLTAVADIPDGVQTTTTITLEILGASDPVCVVESVSRYLA